MPTNALEQKLEQLKNKEKNLKEQRKKLLQKKKEQQLKKSQKIFLKIGKEIEKTLGRELQNEDVILFTEFLKKQEINGKFFTRAMNEKN